MIDNETNYTQTENNEIIFNSKADKSANFINFSTLLNKINPFDKPQLKTNSTQVNEIKEEQVEIKEDKRKFSEENQEEEEEEEKNFFFKSLITEKKIQDKPKDPRVRNKK